MSGTPSQYRKKPVVIEAIRAPDTPMLTAFDERWDSVRDWCSGSTTFDGRQWVCFISTLEGDMAISPGDYVIRGVQGEFYPCKPDIFLASYEAVQP